MIERYSLPEMRGLWSTEARIKKMLEVELAWLEKLAPSRKIPARQVSELRKIIKGGPLAAKVRKKEEKSAHDVVAMLQVVSEALEGKAPKVVQYLHFGLTSSDVLDTALAMQLIDANRLLVEAWKPVAKRLKALARKHKKTWMVGRTHGVHAEPIPFGLKMAGWYAEAQRNIKRLERAGREIAFGNLSGAVGTCAHFPPSFEASVLRKLGLKAEPVSTQVVPRDRYAEYFQMIALSAAAIERFATEIRHLQRTEVREAEEPFGSGQKGSSAMPHKRNPVLCENLCGLARVIRGHTVPMLENVALWHERDISHSSVERVTLPDATELLHFMLHRFARVLDGLSVFPKNMMRNLESSHGLVFSQRVLLTLIDKGLGRMRAYDIVQRNAMETWRTGVPFKETLAADKDFMREMGRGELERLFDLSHYGKSVPKVMQRAGVL
ncbi:MAG: adenylosuccinate lyase [Elusimicrobia bacterium]|nr:MAG: adenylosuccinate lyase [Elusimicrobiota bacterium]